MFQVSQLQKCLKVPESYIAEESIQIHEDLQYREKQVKILDLVVRKTRNSEVRLCKVQWSIEDEEEGVPLHFLYLKNSALEYHKMFW